MSNYKGLTHGWNMKVVFSDTSKLFSLAAWQLHTELAVFLELW